ncbi:hypothetical protein BN2475_50023 [Paraburkholderia ribeironis]|uniref:Uncharacterized protein n=1 Tax=Paraburkholderia ribeironis TaxID=1247936 RepID=A0A1N7RJZ8_9BURK|nr:hypothetical protein BN2475_50023 [Paraburkholderia ribeironis]
MVRHVAMMTRCTGLTEPLNYAILRRASAHALQNGFETRWMDAEPYETYAVASVLLPKALRRACRHYPPGCAKRGRYRSPGRRVRGRAARSASPTCAPASGSGWRATTYSSSARCSICSTGAWPQCARR